MDSGVPRQKKYLVTAVSQMGRGSLGCVEDSLMSSSKGYTVSQMGRGSLGCVPRQKKYLVTNVTRLIPSSGISTFQKGQRCPL